MRRLLIAALFAIAGITLAAADDGAEREARWKNVAGDIFGERPIEDGRQLLKLNIPEQAMDAALVPVSVEFIGDRPIAVVSVIVDNNPMPLAGRFRLGPAFARQDLKLRVRVNEFTLIHAVAETDDGRLYAVSQYIRAAGGCSAPSATASADVLARMGKMQLRRDRSIDPSLVPSRLLISHPNYSGMQQTASGDYTPARYLERVTVSVGGVNVFDMDGGISLSEDPSIAFTYEAKGNAEVDVRMQDSSSSQFAQHFDALQ
ncbi:quinoprotein dehydrogenase-associated SoxYZ-like carrier [Bradyrhizobium erythrophlei]|uniref:quinoprotein dehydrogenase-associated SoxYZ-like carrier n=1 Tax=Bradyrhizobium erythrophlei TaxID=1437360 RepID=UPI0035E772F2